MIVVVPTGNTTINVLLERLSKIPIEKIYHHMITEEEEYPDAAVEVFLPRVVINSDFVLNKALEKVRNLDVLTYIMFLNTLFVLKQSYLVMQRTCLNICFINLLSDTFFTQFRVECEEPICPNIRQEFFPNSLSEKCGCCKKWRIFFLYIFEFPCIVSLYYIRNQLDETLALYQQLRQGNKQRTP